MFAVTKIYHFHKLKYFNVSGATRTHFQEQHDILNSVAMGSPSEPTPANIFLCHNEDI